MGKPCEPSAFGGAPIDRRACWCLLIIARWSGGWLGEVVAEAGARVGPRFGLPVFARSSAWTSMPGDVVKGVLLLAAVELTYLSRARSSRAESSCSGASGIRRRHCGGSAADSGASLHDA